MRSISARLAVWYALAATLTLACLFLAGYQLLQTRLIHGLDLLNAAEFQQVKARLGNDSEKLNLALIDERVRETAEYASVLFYINIHNPSTGMLFYSRNLNGVEIPDVPGKHVYDTDVPGVGPVRAGEFVMNGLDVTIATPTAQITTVMESYVEVCAALLVAMLFVSTAIGYGLSRLALRPVRLISETARRIGSDNLSERMPVADVHDEVSDLARLLNQMFERLEVSFNQIRRFTAEASHELKTPLSLVRLHAEKLLVDGHLAPNQEEALQIQLEELARLNKIIDDLLFLSRAEAHTIKLDLVAREPLAFLANFAQDASALVEHAGLRFEYSHEGQGKAAFEEKWLRQVLLNLLTNAVKASPVGGLVTLTSRFVDSVWQVSVEDQGAGIPADQRERIFERFVRLSQGNSMDDKGNGLGLSICRSIVGLHAGRIFAEAGTNDIGLRAVFEIPADPG
jgi:two-component system heavy metal sensor histidine kinase CusS